MKSNLQQEILNEIEINNLKTFTISDFLHLGNYEQIKKCMQRLCQSNKIRRISKGLYDIPLYSENLKMYSRPNIEDIAKAMARNFNWNICPSGNYALNLLGLSTQVPAKYIFISDGPYKKTKIGKVDIYFKHSNKKDISNYSYKTMLVIQAIKELGKNNISKETLQQIKNKLTKEELQILLKEAKSTSIWIYELIKEMNKNE